MLVDGPAIDKLICEYPDAHWHFDDFPGPDHFAVMLSGDDWRVLEHDDCWLLLREAGGWAFELHVFCPEGAKLPALRKLLAFTFDVLGASVVFGAQGEGQPNARAARVLSHAMGAIRFGNRQMLTRERFREYNHGKIVA